MRLRILGHDVSVTTGAPFLKGDTSLGESDSYEGTIRIRGDIERSVWEATLLHEVIHMIDHYLDLRLSEDMVCGVAQGLFATIRDNPEFLKNIRDGKSTKGTP